MDEKPKEYWHVFLPLMPPVPPNAHEEIRRVAETKIQTSDGQNFWLCFLGSIGQLAAITISYKALNEEKVLPWVSKAFDHAFAALTIAYNVQVDVLHSRDGFYTFACYSDDELPSKMPVQIELNESVGNSVLNLTDALALMCNTGGYRDVVGALSEAIRPSIPKHYRFLALMRASELLSPEEKDRQAWLARYQISFVKKANSQKQFKNFVNELRSRCAHGVSRGAADPIVSLGMNGSADILAAFDVLLEAVVEKLCAVANIQFRILPKQAL